MSRVFNKKDFDWYGLDVQILYGGCAYPICRFMKWPIYPSNSSFENLFYVFFSWLNFYVLTNYFRLDYFTIELCWIFFFNIYIYVTSISLYIIFKLEILLKITKLFLIWLSNYWSSSSFMYGTVHFSLCYSIHIFITIKNINELLL